MLVRIELRLSWSMADSTKVYELEEKPTLDHSPAYSPGTTKNIFLARYG